MTDQPMTLTCDHYWAAHHQPDFPPQLYWVRICMLCGQVDGADLVGQLSLRNRLRRHPVSRVIIRLYQQHITQHTPHCGRPGLSCSQIAYQIGLIPFLAGHMWCAECSGGSSSSAARRSSGMGKTGKQQKRRK